jgi:hypothetical protein
MKKEKAVAMPSAKSNRFSFAMRFCRNYFAASAFLAITSTPL